MQRVNFGSGAKWEEIVGYSRAVKVGNRIEVGGTVAADEHNEVVGKNDPYQQTKYILQKIEKVLERAGATMKDVIRTRIFVTDITKWEEVGKAHGEVFKDIRPCTSMVGISALISPEFFVEIEATALLQNA